MLTGAVEYGLEVVATQGIVYSKSISSWHALARLFVLVKAVFQFKKASSEVYESDRVSPDKGFEEHGDSGSFRFQADIARG